MEDGSTSLFRATEIEPTPTPTTTVTWMTLMTQVQSAFATSSGAGDSQTPNIQSPGSNIDFSSEADGADRGTESQNITDDAHGRITRN
jgi:hypothetical protein